MMENSLYDRVSQLTREQRSALAQQINQRNDLDRSLVKKRLIAFVSSENTLDLSELRNYLGKHLPEYMIPSAIIQLDQLPKLPNGKIDFKALVYHKEDQLQDQPESMQASNSVEQTLIDIWQEVLGTEAVNINDNFFEIGGDSILSIQIVARARKAGIELAPNQLFEHQTIAQLAKLIQETS